MKEKKDYLTDNGYDKEVIHMEMCKHRTINPFLTEAVGSPAFLHSEVSPQFLPQGSPAPSSILTSIYADTQIPAPQRFDIAKAMVDGPVHIDASGKLKYSGDFSTHTNLNLGKSETKKSLNELRLEQEPRWDNFDSVGSSGLGSSTGAEMLDTTRETSASNSRRSSIDLTGSQSSIPDLEKFHSSFQHQHQHSMSGLSHVHNPHSQSQHNAPPHHVQMPAAHQVNHAAFNPFLAAAGQFHPFSAMNPFSSYQSFPMTSSSQQSPYPPPTMTGHYPGGINPYVLPPPSGYPPHPTDAPHMTTPGNPVPGAPASSTTSIPTHSCSSSSSSGVSQTPPVQASVTGPGTPALACSATPSTNSAPTQLTSHSQQQQQQPGLSNTG